MDKQIKNTTDEELGILYDKIKSLPMDEGMLLLFNKKKQWETAKATEAIQDLSAILIPVLNNPFKADKIKVIQLFAAFEQKWGKINLTPGDINGIRK